MTKFEALDEQTLPTQDGPILGRFDGTKHPLLGELNQRLDVHGDNHRSPARVSGTYFHPVIKGDPFYLSGDLSYYATKLTKAGEDELALEVLDEGSRWPETQIKGTDYENLAVRAAQKGKVNFALAIALDSDRMLGTKGPHHLKEVYQDADSDYRMVEFAEQRLSGVTRVYDAVTASETEPDMALRQRLLDTVDLYSAVVAAKSPNGEFPKSIFASTDTNWIAVGIGAVSRALSTSGETQRAAYLESLDPEVVVYSRL